MEKEIFLDGKNYITASEAARLTGYTNDYIGQLCRGGKVEGKVIGRTRYVCRESLEAYDAESKKVMRAGRHRSGYTPKISSVSNTPNATVLGEGREKEYSFSSQGAISHVSNSMMRSVVSVISIAVLLTGMILAPSITTRTTTLFSDGASLSVHKEQFIAGSAALPEVARAYIEIGVWSAYRFLSYIGDAMLETIKRGALAVREFWWRADEHGVRKGMVVVPSVGSRERNRELEARIRNSFSDEVEISINEDGGAGVINPIFRSGKEDEYMFVMVPLGG
ncbi:MAG: helix-turn-helix domain-containing protein [Parcubacteria group bacterium]|nr:helix-turn-helix domain-containing protein [Parcubacteria group bacterium]